MDRFGKDIVLYVLKLTARIVGIIFGTLLFLGLMITWGIQNSNDNKLFLSGKVPNPLPDGFYNGVTSYYVIPSWKGKFFKAEDSSGVNIINDTLRVDTLERYPFETYIASGIKDKSKKVLRIDYDIKTNPWWLRLVVDEIIQIDDGKYLGKTHIRFLPGYPFTLATFRLEK